MKAVSGQRSAVSEAIRGLREHSGKTQQIFATDLGLSLRGYARYEAGHVPEPQIIFMFMAYAKHYKLADAYDILNQAFIDRLAPPQGYQLKVSLKVERLNADR